MSRENVEVVNRLVQAWNARDVDGFIQLFDPKAEVVFRPEVPEPGPFFGHEEIRQWTKGFLMAWDQHHVTIEELSEEGEHIIAGLRSRGRGRDSDIETDDPDWHVFTVRRSRVVRWRNYKDRAEALEAVGLSE